MSDIQSVRTTVKDWITSLIRVDEIDLDAPYELLSPQSTPELPLPANTLIELPVKDLRYERLSLNTIEGSGVFTYQITYRYPGQLTFHQLPTNRCEQLHQYLAAQSLLQLSGCSGIKDVEPDEEEFPVVVQRENGEQKDWYIRVNLVLLINFSLTELTLPPEFGPSLPDEDSELDSLNLKIYRSVSEFSTERSEDFTLDTEITIRN